MKWPHARVCSRSVLEQASVTCLRDLEVILGKLLGRLRVLGGESLAVSAPRCVEFHKKRRILWSKERSATGITIRGPERQCTLSQLQSKVLDGDTRAPRLASDVKKHLRKEIPNRGHSHFSATSFAGFHRALYSTMRPQGI